MKRDLVLDTHILAEVIRQYYSKNVATSNAQFESNGVLRKTVCDHLNEILTNYRSDYFENVAVTSIFSFVEIIRQFNEILGANINLEKFRAFIADPPKWLVIDPFSAENNFYFLDVPASVLMADGQMRPIEWPDAIHVVTYLSREHAYFVTNDSRLIRLPNIVVL
jgi:predicted nucleic acid-binding protein